MNILMIPSWYRNNKNVVKGSFFREQALMFQRRDHNVAVIFVEIHLPSERIPKSIERKNDDGMITYVLHIHSYGYARHTALFKTILKQKYEKLLRLALSEFQKFDVIQAHSFIPAGIIAVELGKKYGIPVVITEHSSKVHTKSCNKIEGEYLKRAVMESDEFICVSDSLKEAVLSYSPHSIVNVIPNNLSDIFYYAGAKNNKLFTFVCVGNLIESKRQRLLIECFAEAFLCEPVKLIIAGDGVLKEKLIQKTRELKIENQVEFLGVVCREDMPQLLNNSDVFVLVSTNETFGVSYIEALACGCPVIATKNGGAEEIVNNTNGILVNVDAKDEIVNALKDIYTNYAKFNTENISKECIEKYKEETIYKMLLAVYMRVGQKK